MREPEDELALIRERNLYRQARLVEPVGPDQIEVEGRRYVQFASNDYLGMTHCEALRVAFAAAVAASPAGAGASRLITGTHPAHRDLEAELADFKGTEGALTFSSGYAVAAGCLPAIVGKGDYVILDKLCHACLIDGARLSGATLRVFPHNDMDKLRSHLHWARRQGGTESRILVLTESVFSMDGDLAELPVLVELKEEVGALLWVDEAHAVGLIGPEGRGLAEQLGLTERIDFQMGTLSKAMGVSGGYVATSGAWIDLLVNSARSFIFSTAMPPAVAAAAAASVRLVRGETGEKRREALWLNVQRLAAGLPGAHRATSPIRPLIVGSSERALGWSEALRARGYWVPAIRYPTVPRDTARLRISTGAMHGLGQIDGLCRAIGELAEDADFRRGEGV